jgi:hypothetical protein
MLISILAILIGALLTAAGAQELIVQGIFNNRLFPLIGGTLGTVAGALILSAGIAFPLFLFLHYRKPSATLAT